MSEKSASHITEEIDLDELIAENDTGARSPEGIEGKLIAGVALVWSLFHIYIASNIPFVLTNLTGLNFTFNSDESRAIHLAFALFLAASAFPLFKSSNKKSIPIYDYILGILGVLAALYLLFDKEAIANRPGLPTDLDLVVSSIGLIILLIATYRSLGLPMVVVASIFLTYVFFGDSPNLPDVIQWRGASYGKAMWHFWMQTEGVFGVALGVSASMVFLFVLFGSLLDKAGAGNYFIQVAFAGLGHLRGGPAKAAVLSSAMTGLISGSSIANTVTTGTFTIPLMKRVGFSGARAGAVEVASSVNGQIMPPVMGAAAFLMVEYVGVSYLDVVRHAVLPAVISYISLFYIVHLEALKANLKGLPKPGPVKSAVQKLMGALGGFAGFGLLCAIVYYGLGWTKDIFGDATFNAVVVIFLAAYIGLVFLASKKPDLELDDPNSPLVKLPLMSDVLTTGLYFLLPIVILVWCLMIERFSPGLSAYWATVAMIIILLTQKPIKAIFRKTKAIMPELKAGFNDLIDGLISGARNMIGIAVATGTAGIIVGTISLTGAHTVMGELIEFLSGGHLMLMLLMVALLSLILGMGLPTTANYIVVSSLMAGVIVEIGAQNGLIVPLIAVHLFVFYFGIMADVTPPVGLASFAAAAISGADPIKTGFTAFYYSLRTVALPFLFIFNTDLLLIDVSVIEGIFVFITATMAMLLFAAGTQGYFIAKSRLWESAILLLVAFTLFRPGYWLDQVIEPYALNNPANIVQLATDLPDEGSIRATFKGVDLSSDKEIIKTVLLPLGVKGEGASRLLETSGIELRNDEGKMIIDNIAFNSYAEKQKLDFDWEVIKVETPVERFPKQLFYLPAFLLLGLVVMVQRRRKEPETA